MFNKCATNCTIERKRKDQTAQTSCCRLGKYSKPNLLPEFDKRLAAELEDGSNQINYKVIVEEFEAGEFCKLTRNGEFPNSGQTKKKDQFHKLNPEACGCCSHSHRGFTAVTQVRLIDTQKP